MLKSLKIASINHLNYPLADVGKFQLVEEDLELLQHLKSKYQLDELQYLNTCNRVELLIYSSTFPLSDFAKLFEDIRQQKKKQNFDYSRIECFEGEAAAEHWMRVASSLKSLVLGEREILTQCRVSYEKAKQAMLSGDNLRQLNQAAIECGKSVFTNTSIARRSVSVVYLAFKELLNRMGSLEGKHVALVGFGQTNQTMLKFLEKQNKVRVSVVNRTLEKIDENTQKKHASFGLDALKNQVWDTPVDVVISCTSANGAIIHNDFLEQNLNPAKHPVLIDLAVPSDYSSEVREQYAAYYIGIEGLKEEVEKNLKERKKEINACESILSEKLEQFVRSFNERMVIRAFRDIPREIAAVKTNALTKVFAKDLEGLGDKEREVLGNILDYMERRCVAIPMSAAKKALS